MAGLARWLVAGALAGTGLLAWAANQPCSGSKGGVSHCAGATFVCKDGSISASKRVCSMAAGGASTLTVVADDDCPCRGRKLCTGPRGGQYCLSDSGKKSYVRD